MGILDNVSWRVLEIFLCYRYHLLPVTVRVDFFFTPENSDDRDRPIQVVSIGKETQDKEKSLQLITLTMKDKAQKSTRKSKRNSKLLILAAGHGRQQENSSKRISKRLILAAGDGRQQESSSDGNGKGRATPINSSPRGRWGDRWLGRKGRRSSTKRDSLSNTNPNAVQIRRAFRAQRDDDDDFDSAVSDEGQIVGAIAINNPDSSGVPDNRSWNEEDTTAGQTPRPDADPTVLIEAQLVDNDTMRERVRNEILVDAPHAEALSMGKLNSRARWRIFFWLLAIGIAVALAVGLTGNRRSDSNDSLSIGPTTSPSSAPSMEPSLSPSDTPSQSPSSSPSVSDLFLLLQAYGALDETDILDGNSAEFKAWEWMAREDASEIAYNTSADADEVIERFAIASIYFATTETSAWSDPVADLFLQNSSVCEWNNRGRGVFCEENSFHVTELKLSRVNLVTSNFPSTIGLLRRLRKYGRVRLLKYGWVRLLFFSFSFSRLITILFAV